MPADIATLSALKARVEAATGPDHGLWLEIVLALLDPAGTGEPALRLGTVMMSDGSSLFGDGTESVDTALNLAGRVLPGWRWVAHSPRSGLAYGASLSDPKRGGWIVPAEHPASAPLAILLALIKAVERLAENPASACQPETSHAR